MGRSSVGSNEAADAKQDPPATDESGKGGKNPQKAMNDFLADPESRPVDMKKSTDDPHFTEQRSRSSTNHSHKSSNSNDEYDYEMQSYWPRPSFSRGQSRTSYIPQYSTYNGGQFPMHHVVPNTQMAMSSSADTSGGANGHLRSLLLILCRPMTLNLLLLQQNLEWQVLLHQQKISNLPPQLFLI